MAFFFIKSNTSYGMYNRSGMNAARADIPKKYSFL